jgi:glucose/mannose transport system substrate-binding protein
MKNTTLWTCFVSCCIALGSASIFAGEVEVLHYWTSGGEAKSVAELKGMMATRGHTWKDFTVTGGGGQNAMAVLKQRVLAGNAPAAANIKGPAIQEWAELNVLTSLDAMASFEKWDDVLPKVVADQMKYKGRYVAVPVNVHRVNWLWSNSSVLKKAGVTTLPKTYDEFFAAADKVKAAGFVAVAHGGQDWQDLMVIKGAAGFQFMGDWAKGEFLAAGQQPGKEFNCSPAPGTASAYTFNVDSFAMFQLKGWEAQKAQGYLAYLLMGNDFQEKFNLRKDFVSTSAAGTLVPSVAHGMAIPSAAQAAMRAAVTEFWSNEKTTIADTLGKMQIASNSKPTSVSGSTQK